MAEPVHEEKLTDLVEVYDMLKRDARDMLLDLLNGVSLWKSTARILFVFAFIALSIGLVFVWGALTTGNVGVYFPNAYGFFIPIPTFLGSLATFMFGVTLVTTVQGMRYLLIHARLRQKYAELYEAASKLE